MFSRSFLGRFLGMFFRFSWTLGYLKSPAVGSLCRHRSGVRCFRFGREVLESWTPRGFFVWRCFLVLFSGLSCLQLFCRFFWGCLSRFKCCLGRGGTFSAGLNWSKRDTMATSCGQWRLYEVDGWLALGCFGFRFAGFRADPRKEAESETRCFPYFSKSLRYSLW